MLYILYIESLAFEKDDRYPNEIVFDLDENDKVLKLIPIIKDIDNPENISNKFKLSIITSTIETIKNNHDSNRN